MARNKKQAEKTSRVARYTTKLEDILTNVLAGNLPEGQYPWVRAPRRGAGGGGGGGGAAGGGGGGAAGGAGADGEGVGGGMSTAAAYHAAHGEAYNRFAVEALREGPAGGAKGGRRAKASRFAGDEGEGGGGGGGAAGGAGAAGPDIYAQFMEAPRQRVYEGGRIIVFVLGGVSQMEVAAVDRLSATTRREIILGSTSLTVADDVIRQLYDLDPSIGDDAAGAFPALDIVLD